MLKDILKKIPAPIKNKYIATIIFFIIRIFFLDDYNLINQQKTRNKAQQLKQKKDFYLSEIEKDSIELYKLQNDRKFQEKFAREKFLMKKENEDVFIIREKEND